MNNDIPPAVSDAGPLQDRLLDCLALIILPGINKRLRMDCGCCVLDHRLGSTLGWLAWWYPLVSPLISLAIGLVLAHSTFLINIDSLYPLAIKIANINIHSTVKFLYVIPLPVAEFNLLN